MAEAILASRLRAHRAGVLVRSSGLRAMGGPADEKARRVLAARGLDLSRHESRAVTNDDIADAALVLAMERAQVAEIAMAVPGSFAKTLGLTEIVRLGERHGPRRDDESIAAWVERLQVDRRPVDVLQADASFDIADPHGGTVAEYERCVEQLTGLLDALVALLKPAAGFAPPPPDP
jgi:protein-tyrosine-phosphatase